MTTRNTLKAGIIYQGPSLLDGAPIVAIGTTGSRNAKTGDMLQVWILRADMLAHTATHTGDDSSICGSCPHRGTVVDGRVTGRSCYVLVHNAPRSVSAKFLRGGYDMVDPTELGRDRKVRIGAYGDPMAVPASVWRSLVSEATGHTGYTHQWNTERQDAADYQDLVMASTDTVPETLQAWAAGWRTFRVSPKGAAPESGEISCPASAESGHKTQCAKCLLCAGKTSKARVSVTINLH